MSNYRPDIDGLRSIAVISVVAYHAGFNLIGGGYAGVDVFFVISGYLITSLIFKEQLEDRFSLRDFYIRRARRLFPALFAVLAVSAAFSWWLLMPSEMEDFGESLATAAAFSSNFMFWSESGYFEGPAEFKPLLHTWSLAVEEQYYLLFPWLLLGCHKSGRYLLILGSVFAASLVLSHWYLNRAPAAAFFLLPHRLWELMIGSILAIMTVRASPLLTGLSSGAREFLGVAGLLAIGYALFGYTSATAFPGLAALPPTLGTAALIIAGSGQGSRASRMLSTRGFVAVGLISYSLYLWHWPVLVFTKLYLVAPPEGLHIAAALALSLLLGFLSWRFIERPFRTSSTASSTQISASSWHFPESRVLPGSALAIAVFIGFGLSLDLTNGAPDRLPAQVVAIAQVANDKPAERKRCTGINSERVNQETLCKIGSEAGSADFLVWGDSHAMTMIPQFHTLANESNRVGLNATSNGCAALLGTWRPADDAERECAKFNDAVLQIIRDTPSLRTIILAGRWAIYAEGTRYKYESGADLALVDGASLGAASEPINPASLKQNAAVWQRSITRTIAALRAQDLQVVIIDSVPEIGWDTPNVIARSQLLGRALQIAPSLEEYQNRQRKVRPTLERLALENPQRIKLLHPAKLLCNTQTCDAAREGTPLYVDEDHLSSAGADALMPLLRLALAPYSPPK